MLARSLPHASDTEWGLATAFFVHNFLSNQDPHSRLGAFRLPAATGPAVTLKWPVSHVTSKAAIFTPEEFAVIIVAVIAARWLRRGGGEIESTTPETATTMVESMPTPAATSQVKLSARSIRGARPI